MGLRILRYTIVSISLAALCLNCLGQDPVDPLIEQVLESLPEEEKEQFDLVEFTGLLNDYLAHPLNLNTATAGELGSLLILNELQVQAILEHRELSGPFRNVLELQSVDRLDLPLVRKLLPFVTVSEEQKEPPGLGGQAGLSHEVLLRYSGILNSRKGYRDPPSYAGGPGRVLARYRITGSDLSFNLTLGKDPGESFFSSGQGFDSYSANLFLQDKGYLKKLVAGDYLLQFGQGVALWNGYSSNMGPAVLGVARQEAGIKPFRSSDESYFFRGAAATLEWGTVELTPFFSYKKLDAALEPDGEREWVSTIRRSGLHRTEGEIAGKHRLGETVAGIHLGVRPSRLFTAGATAYTTRFDKPLKRGEAPYQLFDFSGDELNLLAVNYQFGRRNYFLFGEVAHSLGSGSAFVNGILFSPAPFVSLAAAYRNYQKNYHAFYASPIGQQAAAGNERGWYMAADFRILDRWGLSLSADAFTFPWLRYRVNAPSNGYQLFSQLEYRPGKETLFYFRYRKRNHPAYRQTHIRFHTEYRLSRQVRLKNRVEYTSRRQEVRNQGFLAYQDVSWSIPPGRFHLDVRGAFFNTDDYYTRIYAYENDVLYASSFAFYYDKGTKFYLSGRWKVNRMLDCWLRYELLRFFDRDTIGSGDEEIEGSHRSDVRIQLRIKL